jgi:hypothetical protein
VAAIDEASAPVVRRIFGEYLDGKGDGAIAHGLNVDGIPCRRRGGPIRIGTDRVEDFTQAQLPRRKVRTRARLRCAGQAAADHRSASRLSRARQQKRPGLSDVTTPVLA